MLVNGVVSPASLYSETPTALTGVIEPDDGKVWVVVSKPAVVMVSSMPVSAIAIRVPVRIFFNAIFIVPRFTNS